MIVRPLQRQKQQQQSFQEIYKDEPIYTLFVLLFGIVTHDSLARCRHSTPSTSSRPQIPLFFFTFQPMDVNFVSVENMTKFHSKNQEKRKTKKKKKVVLALNS